MKDIKEYSNTIEYFQLPRNIYWKLTRRLYGIDCCSFASANFMINLIFPTILYKEFNSISHTIYRNTIYRNYKRSKDCYKQIKPIKLNLKEDDKWTDK